MERRNTTICQVQNIFLLNSTTKLQWEGPLESQFPLPWNFFSKLRPVQYIHLTTFYEKEKNSCVFLSYPYLILCLYLCPYPSLCLYLCPYPSLCLYLCPCPSLCLYLCPYLSLCLCFCPYLSLFLCLCLCEMGLNTCDACLVVFLLPFPPLTQHQRGPRPGHLHEALAVPAAPVYGYRK